MAFRPVFTVLPDQRLWTLDNTEFEFFKGFSDAQKRRCIHSLHASYLRKYPDKKILEISSKSENELGVKLSAFNLTIHTEDGKTFSVESAYQAGKVFQYGGPYTDLLEVSSRAAKKDPRMKNSGSIIGFTFNGEDFPTTPRSLFYDWLYINTLHQYPELTEPLMEYDAFTDIVFNPEKSSNCQAQAAAIYVSLHKQNLLEEALKSKETFSKIVYGICLQ